MATLVEANARLSLAALRANELQAEAELSRRKQTEFIAVLAHELRSPLVPIRMATLLLGRTTGDELERLQAIIHRQVTHLARLADDLLDLSRVNTGKLRLEREVVDLTCIVDAAAAACRPAMSRRHQQFTIRMPDEPVELDADPVRLTQVLSNLLDNASTYSPGGSSIALSIDVDPIRDVVVTTVSDSGMGMSKAALCTVFEPFTQDRHAMDVNATGLGIGLTLVRELVETHGGSVVATSGGPGMGSQFVVTLPRGRVPLKAAP